MELQPGLLAETAPEAEFEVEARHGVVAFAKEIRSIFSYLGEGGQGRKPSAPNKEKRVPFIGMQREQGQGLTNICGFPTLVLGIPPLVPGLRRGGLGLREVGTALMVQFESFAAR